MKLKKFLLRYYPPGIILEYQKSNGETEIKSIDLLNLNEDTVVPQLVDEILNEEPLIPSSKKHYLVKLIDKLVEKVTNNKYQNFKLFKQLKAHKQPLTNCAFNKYGTQFLTGSYDRTCKLWDSKTGECLQTL